MNHAGFDPNSSDLVIAAMGQVICAGVALGECAESAGAGQFTPCGKRRAGSMIDALQESVLARITAPADVHVLVSSDCPHCGSVVAAAHALRARCACVSVRVTDVAEARDLLSRHGIGSVPATILDDELVVQGQVTATELARLLGCRRTPAWDTERVRAWLDSNRLDAAVQFVRQEGRAACVLPILQGGELSARMGVTLVLQTAHEQEPGSVGSAVPGLIELLASEQVNVRGDVADLLGSLGDSRALQPLRALLQDEDDDVRAAARDAIDALHVGMPC
ncbi:MAG: thioredoxin family protein [Polyangiaceae bacterium]|nr:thioredoxin family protein [Polyangiaceae bacterium]